MTRPFSDRAETTAGPRVPRPGLWLWFLAGFTLVYVGLAALGPVHVMHSSGAFVMPVKVWQLYLDQVPRKFQSVRPLGPSSSNEDTFWRVLREHLLVSAAGGLLASGLSWLINRSRRRTDRVEVS